VFLMEAFMYRCHPQTALVMDLVRRRAIGEVRMIQATFSFRSQWDPDGRLLNNALGGGGILDVGGYPVSMARRVAGVATGGEWADPLSLQGYGRVGETGVDEYAAAVLKFPGDIVAQVACGVQVQQENVVRIYGTRGHIFVPSPWLCSVNGGPGKVVIHRPGEPTPEETVVESPRGLYALEADAVAAHISRRQVPEMTWDDTLGNMRTLDRWRAAVGVTYEADRV
jgi:predicted dehydrogenase